MKDPAYLFYPADFIIGCSDLTMEERGQYITLLCMQHQKGHLSRKTIGLSLGFDWDMASVDLRKKFTEDENGLFYNERLEEEITKRSEFIDKQRNNGRKGGRPKNPNKTQTQTQIKPKNNPTENENVNENINKKIVGGVGEEPDIFENVWAMYGRKGNKKTSLLRWNNLTKKAKKQALQHIPRYVESTPEIQYRKNFETYLNQEAWNDEIIIGNGQRGQQQTGGATGGLGAVPGGTSKKGFTGTL